MSEDFTSLKVVGRFLAACAASVFLLIRLSASDSDPRSKDGPASFVRPQPDAPTAAVTTLPVKDSVQQQQENLSVRAPENEQTLYIDPPGIVEEDDAPAGVKEVEQRHAREDAAGEARSYGAGPAQ